MARQRKIMKKNVLQSIKVIVLGLILSLGISYVFAATINPLNVGSSAQSKAGSLAVGTSAAITPGFKLEAVGFLQSTGLNVNGRAVISGKVGIGTIAPASKLSVNGGMTITGGGKMKINSLAGNGTKKICVDDTGKLILCPLQIPTVITTAVTNITATTATSGGNVTSDGGSPVTQRGVVWNVEDSYLNVPGEPHSVNGTGTGSFTSSITGLDPDITWYVRAYATNSVGTGYGNTRTFATVPGGSGSIIFKDNIIEDNNGCSGCTAGSFELPYNATITIKLKSAGGDGGGGGDNWSDCPAGSSCPCPFGAGGGGGGGGSGGSFIKTINAVANHIYDLSTDGGEAHFWGNSNAHYYAMPGENGVNGNPGGNWWNGTGGAGGEGGSISSGGSTGSHKGEDGSTGGSRGADCYSSGAGGGGGGDDYGFAGADGNNGGNDSINENVKHASVEITW